MKPWRWLVSFKGERTTWSWVTLQATTETYEDMAEISVATDGTPAEWAERNRASYETRMVEWRKFAAGEQRPVSCFAWRPVVIYSVIERT